MPRRAQRHDRRPHPARHLELLADDDPRRQATPERASSDEPTAAGVAGECTEGPHPFATGADEVATGAASGAPATRTSGETTRVKGATRDRADRTSPLDTAEPPDDETAADGGGPVPHNGDPTSPPSALAARFQHADPTSPPTAGRNAADTPDDGGGSRPGAGRGRRRATWDDLRPAPLTPAALAAVVRSVLTEPGDLDGPELLRVTSDRRSPTGITVAVRSTPDGCHPVEALVGLAAGPHWLAVGVRARGRAAPVDGGGAVPVLTAHLVGVDGSWASSWVDPAPTRPGSAHASDARLSGAAHGRAGDPASPTGRVDDACRRTLGLPTDAAPPSTAPLWPLLWLDSLVEHGATAAGRRRLRTWPFVAELHPAAPLVDLVEQTGDHTRSDRHGRSGPHPGELAAAMDLLTHSTSWARLRRAAAAHVWVAPGVDALTAAWLDDGSFARWTLGALPNLEDLLDAVRSVLSDSTWSRVEASLGIGDPT